MDNEKREENSLWAGVYAGNSSLKKEKHPTAKARRRKERTGNTEAHRNQLNHRIRSVSIREISERQLRSEQFSVHIGQYKKTAPDFSPGWNGSIS